MYFVYYSAEAADRYGFVYYRLESGEIVPCTGAYESEEKAKEYNWPDKKLMGKGTYSHKGLEGAIHELSSPMQVDQELEW
jgi:hypothetical protein